MLSSESENCKEYIKTNPENLTVLKDGEDGRKINPVPYTGESEEFSVNLSDEEPARVKDGNGDIQFSEVMDWCLPHVYDSVPNQPIASPKVFLVYKKGAQKKQIQGI